MPKVIVMVHSHMSEVVLCGFLNRIKDTQVIHFPYPTLMTEFAKYTNIEIDYVIVEANYGTPASFEINSTLLNSVIENFPNTKIIAYSGTMEALAETLRAYPQPNVAVMNKNNKLEEDTANIYAYLSTQYPELNPQDIFIAPRVYTTAKLKEELLLEKVRLRSSTVSQERSPSFTRNSDTRPRASTQETITPLFDLTTQRQEEQPSWTQNVVSEKYSKTVTKMDM